jgi:hypothetical protein
MKLLQQYLLLLSLGWGGAFRQRRTLHRAIEHALAQPCVLGRRTVSRTICALGRQQQGWGSDYRLFSRSRWEPERLFDPVFQEFLRRFPDGPVPVALDDTALKKSGRRIPGAFWQYDHMSPPFHSNLLYGLRFIQASVLFPHYREGDFPARAYPVRFADAPAAKKPGKRASEEQKRHYRAEKKRLNLSAQALSVLKGVRESLDQAGARSRPLLAATDGSYCNRTVFTAGLERTRLVSRCRKDACLCFAEPQPSRRFYAAEKFTPESVRQDQSIAWKGARAHYAGKRRDIRYKEVRDVLWQGGARRKMLRLIVIAPQPYRPSKKSKVLYRQPAYLLTDDLESPACLLIQAYLDRWQIEVNHREEKDILGVGQAQVRSPLSVPRHPAFTVAAYSLLLLASLQAFGPGRDSGYLPLPKWRKKAKRPSLLDILTLLRMEMNERPNSMPIADQIRENTVAYAYT